MSWFFYYSVLAVFFWIAFDYLKGKVNIKNKDLLIKIGKCCIVVAYITYVINTITFSAYKVKIHKNIYSKAKQKIEKIQKNDVKKENKNTKKNKKK